MQKATESKSEGASRDFKGTYMAYIELPKINECISKWALENIDRNDIEYDKRVCKGGLVTEQSINILLGLPSEPTEEVLDILKRMPKLKLRIGETQCFEEESVRTDDGVLHRYRVLSVKISESSQQELTRMQRTLGILYGGVNSPITWHFPVYRPHLTIGFIKSDACSKYIGKQILPVSYELEVDTIRIKKFQDKTFEPITVHLL